MMHLSNASALRHIQCMVHTAIVGLGHEHFTDIPKLFNTFSIHAAAS